MASGPGKKAPRALRRWYAADITAGRSRVIAAVFDEAERRDPGHARTWIVLVDGDNHQLEMIRSQAARAGHHPHGPDRLHPRAGIPVEGSLVLPPGPRPGDRSLGHRPGAGHPARPVSQVIARIEGMAAAAPPRPGSEHAKIIRKPCPTCRLSSPSWTIPAPWPGGWPIATGVIEGACRHLVQDRMGITGARWGLEGAQAILWLRTLHANGDLDAYWDWHIEQERQRNHLSRYQQGLELAA